MGGGKRATKKRHGRRRQAPPQAQGCLDWRRAYDGSASWASPKVGAARTVRAYVICRRRPSAGLSSFHVAQSGVGPPRSGACLQEIEMRKMILAVATILTVAATASAFAAGGGGGGGGGTDNPMPTAQTQATND
jgi:hypothetical protein